MSARESIENLWDRAFPVSPLLDAYAHELAEKIRAERRGRYGTGSDEEFWPADLIDPEIS